MAVLAGIDEAGFGPLLGPLVVSSCSFSIPRELLKVDLWHVLRKSVGGRRARLLGRLLICDSKKAHNKALGIKHLERTTLACLKVLGTEPGTVAGLLEALGCDCLARIDEYPWYQNIGGHILGAAADIGVAASALARDMGSNGMKLLGVRSCCLDVGHYNRLVDAVKNKSNVLFTAISQLITEAWKAGGEEEVQIIVDRQGGRVRYQQKLQTMFPEAELAILKETETHSSYQLQEGKRSLRIHFVVGADDKFLPVSLASMVSKYVRELLVANINRYFAGFCAELKPTAGYWKDGQRFIRDLKTYAPQVQYDSSRLIRSR
jgi:ribonuclease HII